MISHVYQIIDHYKLQYEFTPDKVLHDIENLRMFIVDRLPYTRDEVANLPYKIFFSLLPKAKAVKKKD